MQSHDHVRNSYRRFFAWTAAVTLVIVLALVAAEVVFPEAVESSRANAATGGLDPDLYDVQLLLLVVAMVACLASIAGLVIVAFLDAVELRKLRRRRAFDARLHRPEGRTAYGAPPRAEPRNARLRALRDVVHSLEKS